LVWLALRSLFVRLVYRRVDFVDPVNRVDLVDTIAMNSTEFTGFTKSTDCTGFLPGERAIAKPNQDPPCRSIPFM